MNGSYIILYAGAPLQLPGVNMVQPRQATVFASEADGWAAVRRHHLTVRYCRVVELNTFLEMGTQTTK